MLKRSFTALLLPWFDTNKRPMPWRNTRDAYAIWVSEVMLQQTQVATVIPYFERFLRRFPSVADLAAAPLHDVLVLWAGLGYYRRAKHLHKCACTVVNLYGGVFPTDAASLQELPGIGRYTAAAIASIAADQSVAVLDGNVKRVLARLLALRVDVSRPAATARLWDIAESLVPLARPGDYNQAMMELGATVCLPQSPRCDACPAQSLCRAAACGRQHDIPRKRPARVTPTMHCAAAAIRHGNRWLLVQRPNEGLWNGLWELPTIWSRPPRDTAAAQRAFCKLLAGKVEKIRPIVTLQHQLTHRRIDCTLFAGEMKASQAKAMVQASRGRWVSRADELPTSRLTAKLIAAASAALRGVK
ncbi:MAG: A/G-specific adenine glycosylase [Phycisphaerales bacterium]|nr:A/G-specific adenine glycosylase [Phycisphaerales bacterium]